VVVVDAPTDIATLLVTAPNRAEMVILPVAFVVVVNANDAPGVLATMLIDTGTVSPGSLDLKGTQVSWVMGPCKLTVQVPDPPG